MSDGLDERWYVAVVADMRIRTNPKVLVTYWVVTYIAPDDSIETRFLYEQIGGAEPTMADWQRLAREHKSNLK